MTLENLQNMRSEFTAVSVTELVLAFSFKYQVAAFLCTMQLIAMWLSEESPMAS